MEFYISFGKDKDKENHISKFNNKKKLDFSIIISQLNKYTNEREYAYLKAETWDWNVIEALAENKRFKMGEFYFRFFKDKNGNNQWVVVIKSLGEEQKKQTLKEDFNLEELNDIFRDTLTINKDKKEKTKEEDFELDF